MEKKKVNSKNIKSRKKSQKKDYYVYECLSALIVTVILFAVSFLSLIGKDREYSENENRYLTTKPQFSWSSLMDGKFMDDAEAYLSDQFLLRDKLVSLRTGIDVFFGKREINDVYIGKKHFLYEKPSEYNETRLKKTTDAMNNIRARNPGINTYIAIAPNSTEIVSAYLPSNAPVPSQTEQIKKIYGSLNGFTLIDLCTPLKSTNNPQDLYYRTDHHWTSAAVDIAYVEIAKKMGLDPASYQYRNLAVTDSFRGTLASSSGIFSAQDTISIPTCPSDVMYRVTYVEEERVTTSVFDPQKLNSKSKYEVFFGGNYPEVVIESSASNEKVLMVVKDSYANSLIPLLIPHYKKIIIIDPRYYNGNIQDIIDTESVTDMLWLYNANTFLNDTSIAGKFS